MAEENQSPSVSNPPSTPPPTSGNLECPGAPGRKGRGSPSSTPPSSTPPSSSHDVFANANRTLYF